MTWTPARAHEVAEEARMVLVQLSVVEQRLAAVQAVLAGATATEVAASVGMCSQMRRTVHPAAASRESVSMSRSRLRLTFFAQ